MIVLAIAAALLVVAGVGWARPWNRTSVIQPVVPGPFVREAKAHLRLDDDLVRRLDSVTSLEANHDPGRRSGRPRPAFAAPKVPSSDHVAVGLTAGAISGAEDLYQWLTPDHAVLDAVTQMTHENITDSLDLWGAVHDHGYELWKHSSLINWRGHVGEHDLLSQLHSWGLGDRAHLWEASNYPGSDISIDGHEFNVKVSGDYANVGPEHFAHYPDIPIIVNSDAAHIPASALHVDFSQPFDPSILDGHDVIVADGLTASGIEQSLQDALGDGFGGLFHGFDDIGDVLGAAQDAGLPVIGSAIRVVRSGVREGRLHGVHGDTGRLLKNISTDVALTGAGVAVGQVAGHVLGGAVDVMTFGATAGFGTIGGGIVGAALGGIFGNKGAQKIRYAGVRAAQDKCREAVEAYSAEIDRVSISADEEWSAVLEEMRRHVSQVTQELDQWFAAAVLAAKLESDGSRLFPRATALQDLSSARVAVAEASSTERGLVRWMRLRQWKHAADAAVTVDEVYDVVRASPGGEDLVRTRLEQARMAQEAALATCMLAARLCLAMAMAARQAMALDLTAARERLQDGARSTMAEPLARVEQTTAAVERELVASGLKDA